MKGKGYEFHIEEKKHYGPPLAGELAVVNLPVNVVFEWSDKLIDDCDYDEEGNVIESSITYKSGFIMNILPQRVIYNGESRITVAQTMKETVDKALDDLALLGRAEVNIPRGTSSTEKP